MLLVNRICRKYRIDIDTADKWIANSEVLVDGEICTDQLADVTDDQKVERNYLLLPYGE